VPYSSILQKEKFYDFREDLIGKMFWLWASTIDSMILASSFRLPQVKSVKTASSKHEN
jgi:hypothetical protein